MKTEKLLRSRGQGDGRVTNEELFFDLIYAFAVTQLSRRLFEDVSLVNAAQTLVLWFAVWLGWQYTCWVTNWFNPQATLVRVMLFVVMLLGLVMAAAIPGAYGARGWIFAVAYVAIQVGRTLFVLWQLGSANPLSANFRRIFGWILIAAMFWIAGGLSEGINRLILWTIAVLCEYVSPMTGFWLPVLGRSETHDWNIDGAHLAERCQLFVMMALGESVLVTGASVSQTAVWSAPVLVSLLVAFLSSIALWWLYFDTSSDDGTDAITRSADPGRVGARFHYVHVALIAGIIIAAVANELIIAEPRARIDSSTLAVLIGGAMTYLLANLAYKRVVNGHYFLPHAVGLLMLGLVAGFANWTDRLMVGGLVALTLLGVAIWEGCQQRSNRAP